MPSNSSDVVAAGSDPSTMGMKQIRRELETLGVETKLFVEKSKMIDALVNARKEGMVLFVDGKGPLCYTCLDGGNETEGPLRRDCACHGDNVGYAHLSCLVQYARSERMEACVDAANRQGREDAAAGVTSIAPKSPPKVGDEV